MTGADQNALRNELLTYIFAAIDKDPRVVPAAIGAATACVGAAAVAIAVIPTRRNRQKVVAALVEHLEKVVENRAAEIRSGAFDRDQNRARS